MLKKGKLTQYYIWIIAALGGLIIVFAVLPLFSSFYIPTHDGEYHIIRIVEFSKMLSSGYMFPRWAPTLNSGYGIPIFNFHYPLPNYIGSFVRLFTHDAVYAFQASMALGYIGAAVGCFLWLLSLYGAFPAIIGTVVGAFVPYWFVDMYVRGSIGEVWAIALLFFVLFAIEKKQYIGIALFYGLLLLSHNILGMIFSPFLLVYMFLRDKKGIGSLFGGMGLSAFFWLPALLEQRYVVGLNTVNFKEHFVALYELLIPSWGTEFSGSGFLGNKISFQLGIVPIGICIAALIVYARQKQKKQDVLVGWFLGLLGITIVFMLPFSKGIWELVKPLQLVQYPWRFLSFMIPTVAFFTAYVTKKAGFHYWVIGIMIGAVLMTFPYTRKVAYAPRNEAYYLTRSNFTDGTSSMGNSFSTIWSGWKEVKPAAHIAVEGGQIIKQIQETYLTQEFMVAMEKDGQIAIHTLYFPGWKAYRDTKEAAITYESDGIIHISVPAGEHTLRVVFVDTPVRRFGNIVSFLSFVSILICGILSYIRKMHKGKVS